MMFTNGKLNPLATIGVQADTRFNPEAPDRKSTIVVPGCNKPPEGNEVFGLVYEGQVHGSDLSRRNVTGSVDEGLACLGGR